MKEGKVFSGKLHWLQSAAWLGQRRMQEIEARGKGNLGALTPCLEEFTKFLLKFTKNTSFLLQDVHWLLSSLSYIYFFSWLFNSLFPFYYPIMFSLILAVNLLQQRSPLFRVCRAISRKRERSRANEETTALLKNTGLQCPKPNTCKDAK